MDTSSSPFLPPNSTSLEHTLDPGPEQSKDIPQNYRSINNINNKLYTTLTIAASQEVFSSPDSSLLHKVAAKAPSMSSPTAQPGEQELVGSYLPQAPVPGRFNPRSAISSNAELLEQTPSQVIQEQSSAPLLHHLFNNNATTAAPSINILQEANTLLETFYHKKMATSLPILPPLPVLHRKMMN